MVAPTDFASVAEIQAWLDWANERRFTELGQVLQQLVLLLPYRQGTTGQLSMQQNARAAWPGQMEIVRRWFETNTPKGPGPVMPAVQSYTAPQPTMSVPASDEVKRQTLVALRTLMVTLYGNSQDIQRVAADVGAQTTRIRWGTGAVNEWQDLLAEMDKSTLLGKLAVIAANDYPPKSVEIHGYINTLVAGSQSMGAPQEQRIPMPQLDDICAVMRRGNCNPDDDSSRWAVVVKLAQHYTDERVIRHVVKTALGVDLPAERFSGQTDPEMIWNRIIQNFYKTSLLIPFLESIGVTVVRPQVVQSVASASSQSSIGHWSQDEFTLRNGQRMNVIVAREVTLRDGSEVRKVLCERLTLSDGSSVRNAYVIGSVSLFSGSEIRDLVLAQGAQSPNLRDSSEVRSVVNLSEKELLSEAASQGLRP